MFSLRWEAGPIPEDGVWAPWWYKSVHESTGFSSPKKYPRVRLLFVAVNDFKFNLRCVGITFLLLQTFPLSHYDLLEQSLPLYNILRSHVKHRSTLLSSPLPPPSLPVPENAKLLAWVGDEILPREMAKVCFEVWKKT